MSVTPILWFGFAKESHSLLHPSFMYNPLYPPHLLISSPQNWYTVEDKAKSVTMCRGEKRPRHSSWIALPLAFPLFK